MKLTVAFIFAAVAIATIAHGQELSRSSKRCHPNPGPGGGNKGGGGGTGGGGSGGSGEGTHGGDGGGGGGKQGLSGDYCGSSAVAGLIGLNLLNCLDLNILSNISKRKDVPIATSAERGIGGWAEHKDEHLESLKKRAGLKNVCEDAALDTLKKDGLLDCQRKVFHVSPGYKACQEVCESSAGGLLAAINALNCAHISILSSEKSECPRGFTSELPEKASEELLQKREMAEKRTDEIEAMVMPLLRRQLASRACERANQELGTRILDCSSHTLETRLIGPVAGLLGGGGGGGGESESSGENKLAGLPGASGKLDVCQSSASGLIALGALNCADINILSNISRGGSGGSGGGVVDQDQAMEDEALSKEPPSHRRAMAMKRRKSYI